MPYKSPYSSFGEGLNQGVSLAADIDRMRQQRREREWNRDVQLGKAGLEVFSQESLSPKIRMNGYNTYRTTANKWMPELKLPELTEEELQNSSLKEVSKRLKKAMASDVDPQLTLSTVNDTWIDYFTQKGQVKEMQQMTVDIAKGKYSEQQKNLRDASSAGGADSPSKIKAEIQRKYMQDPNSLSPQEQALVAEDLVDPAMKYAMTAYGQNLGNMGNLTPEAQTAVLETLRKTFRSAMDTQAKMGAPVAAPGGVPKSPGSVPTVTFIDSTGAQHTIDRANLEKAQQRDPGLRIIGE